MSKKCVPGVICIENVTIGFIVFIIIVIGFFFYSRNNGRGQYNGREQYDSRRGHQNGSSQINGRGLYNGRDRVNVGQDLDPILMREMPIFSEDVLLNPYDAPIRDDRYSRNLGRFMPINVPTQNMVGPNLFVDSNYSQVGILTRIKGKETILPLMGRPLLTNRDKWNFYTVNDSNNIVQLPITYRGRSCTSENGCDNLSSGDIVFVEGYNDAFKVTAYDNQVMRYIPFI